MLLIDYILGMLGIHEITSIKEAWTIGVLLVFLIQLGVAWIYLRNSTYLAFGLYLVLAAIRDVAHYFPWWTWKWEAFASGIAMLAAMEAAIRVTYFIRIYQRSYTRHGIFIMALTAVSWAAFQVPGSYPGFDSGVYFIRLYMNTFCFFTIVVSLLCVFKNWNAVEMMESWHAMVLAGWFGCFVWEDRLMVRGEAWFAPAIAQLAIQIAGLALWWWMEKARGRRATCVSITESRSLSALG